MVLEKGVAAVRADEFGEIVAGEKRDAAELLRGPSHARAGVDAVEIEDAEFVVAKERAADGGLDLHRAGERLSIGEAEVRHEKRVALGVAPREGDVAREERRRFREGGERLVPLGTFQNLLRAESVVAARLARDPELARRDAGARLRGRIREAELPRLLDPRWRGLRERRRRREDRREAEGCSGSHGGAGL